MRFGFDVLWAQGMMAPVCVSCRLLLSAVFVCVVSVTCHKKCQLCPGSWSPSTLSYPSFYWKTVEVRPRWTEYFLPETPAHLCRVAVSSPWRRRQGRWGKRSGLLVRIKCCLAMSPGTNPQGILADYGSDHHHFVSWRSLDPVYTWLVAYLLLAQRRSSRSPAFVHPVSYLSNPSALDRAPRMANGPGPTRLALVNARSLFIYSGSFLHFLWIRFSVCDWNLAECRWVQLLFIF